MSVIATNHGRGINRIKVDRMNDMLFGLFYFFAITVLVLHFTGWLADRSMEWLVFVVAALVFPVVLFL